MMDETKGVVELLNAPPLDLGITILEFCQKSPQQLRQLLFCVLSAIVPPQGVQDSPEATISWMIEVLRVLKYRPNIEGTALREGIATGRSDAILPLLAWLLPQIDMLQKRAYLARFLVDVEIPPELLLEEDVNMLHARYEAVREQFKATHRHLESLRQIEGDPTKVKEEVLELETEREHLQTKISKLKSKLQDMEKSDQMIEVVGELKSQIVEGQNLTTAINEQRRAVASLSDKHQKSLLKLQQMQNLLANSHNGARNQTAPPACSSGSAVY